MGQGTTTEVQTVADKNQVSLPNPPSPPAQLQKTGGLPLNASLAAISRGWWSQVRPVGAVKAH